MRLSQRLDFGQAAACIGLWFQALKQWRRLRQVLGVKGIAMVAVNAEIVAELATMYRSQFKPMFDTSNVGCGSD